MYFVYLLRLNNNTVYVGFTQSLKKRLTYHQTGDCDATKNYRPVKLVWSCCFEDKIKALQFEKYLKSGSGAAFRNKRLL